MFLTRIAGPKPRLIVVGLEIESLAKFRNEPMATHIRLNSPELELSREVVLFSAPTILSAGNLRPREGVSLVLLDFSTIDRLMRGPLRETIFVQGDAIGIDDNILIFSGKDPVTMMHHFETIGFEVHATGNTRIDSRLKH